MKALVFSDEITLYWEKEWNLPDGVRYRVLLNGEVVLETSHTHAALAELLPGTDYTMTGSRPTRCRR